MIRSRALESPGDLCCLPSPHRVPRGVAGIAFNFSKVELSHRPAPRTPVEDTHLQAEIVRSPSGVKRVRNSFSTSALQSVSS
jgi:hypothetical protein